MEKSRRISIYPTAGQEGKAIEKNLYAGKALAVFTSGGDAQGTNTLVLAIHAGAIDFELAQMATCFGCSAQSVQPVVKVVCINSGGGLN